MSWSLARMARYISNAKYLEHIRQNDDACAKTFKNAKYLIFSNNAKPLLASTPDEYFAQAAKLTTYQETEAICGSDFQLGSTLLGMHNDECMDSSNASNESIVLFACPCTNNVDETHIPHNSRFRDMRSAITTVSQKDAGIVSRGYSMLNWLASMKYCPTCAHPLMRNCSGTMVTCEKCTTKNHHYPKIHPVAITLVEHETGQKVLVVRQARHPPGMYSAIAGFIESGESLEEGVRREVAEEAGIVIQNINFFASQTWPLPQDTLMLACTARAMPGSIVDIDHEELEDAKWVTKEEVREAYQRIKSNPGLLRKNETKEFIIPPSGAIAHELLKNWMNS